jgi:hypothetical protein
MARTTRILQDELRRGQTRQVHPEVMHDQAHGEARRLSGRASTISAFLETGRTPAGSSLEDYQQFGRDLIAFSQVIDDESLDRVCRCARHLEHDARVWLQELGRHIVEGFNEIDRNDVIRALVVLDWAWGSVCSYWSADDEVDGAAATLDLGVVDHEAGEKTC